MYLDRASSEGSEQAAFEDKERGGQLLDQALELFQRCDAKKDIEKVLARKELLTA